MNRWMVADMLTHGDDETILVAVRRLMEEQEKIPARFRANSKWSPRTLMRHCSLDRRDHVIEVWTAHLEAQRLEDENHPEIPEEDLFFLVRLAP